MRLAPDRFSFSTAVAPRLSGRLLGRSPRAEAGAPAPGSTEVARGVAMTPGVILWCCGCEEPPPLAATAAVVVPREKSRTAAA